MGPSPLACHPLSHPAPEGLEKHPEPALSLRKGEKKTPGEGGVRNTYLRVSLEVSLVKRLEVARLRAWGSEPASWDRVGEVGGAE